MKYYINTISSSFRGHQFCFIIYVHHSLKALNNFYCENFGTKSKVDAFIDCSPILYENTPCLATIHLHKKNTQAIIAHEALHATFEIVRRTGSLLLLETMNNQQDSEECICRLLERIVQDCNTTINRSLKIK